MGRELSWANACAAFGEAIRRRWNSPSCATRTTLVPVTAVFGSTNTSTPRRSFAHWASSTATALRSDRLSRLDSSESLPDLRNHENIPTVDSFRLPPHWPAQNKVQFGWPSWEPEEKRVKPTIETAARTREGRASGE